MKKFLPVLLAALLSHPAAAQDLPPITPDLVGTSAIVCINVAVEGHVAGAFVIQSAGSAAKDKALLAWVRKLRWPKAQPSEEAGRKAIWLPMPVAIGEGMVAPPMPASCAPPQNHG